MSDADAQLTQSFGCAITRLPQRLADRSAELARRINNENSFLPGLELAVVGGPTPARLTVSTRRRWPAEPRELTVSFMEKAGQDFKERIVSHLNAWTKTACISFRLVDQGGAVRITLNGGGHWSYLGTDVLLIPAHLPTMSLQSFSMNTSESEYKRVVRHEAGHTLGFEHEHMRDELIKRIDPEKAYRHFAATQGWDKLTVDQQVLTPLDQNSIMGTPADQTSIMCYQLPGRITRDGKPIVGGLDINATDYEFAGTVYPKPGVAAADAFKDVAPPTGVDWDSANDVTVEEALSKLVA